MKARLTQTRDLIDTVMRTTATKREARKYIAKYGINGTGIGPIRRISVIKLNYSSKDNLEAIARSITHLMMLGANPLVLLDSRPESKAFLTGSQTFQAACQQLRERTRRLSNFLDLSGKSTPFTCPFTPNSQQLTPSRDIPNLLATGRIPVLAGMAYDSVTSKINFIDGNEALEQLVKDLDADPEVEVDKVVIVDPSGGMPSAQRKASHIFINLVQEFSEISAELLLSGLDPLVKQQKLEDLRTLSKLLPTSMPMRTGIMTTPSEAASVTHRNPIVYNLLTDRPLISPSLPLTLTKTQLATSLVRPGFPVKVIYDENGFDLARRARAGEINLSRLTRLIEASFGRSLDVEHYLQRIKNKFAAIIVVGDYDGAAIITWELSKTGTPIAYLDKFAVDPSSQGTAGVADIMLIEMVRRLFPNEIVWRSRSNNPVNKWYFERAKGFYRIPDSQWVMFWNSSETRPPINEYVDICKSIEPSLR